MCLFRLETLVTVVWKEGASAGSCGGPDPCSCWGGGHRELCQDCPLVYQQTHSVKMNKTDFSKLSLRVDKPQLTKWIHMWILLKHTSPCKWSWPQISFIIFDLVTTKKPFQVTSSNCLFCLSSRPRPKAIKYIIPKEIKTYTKIVLKTNIQYM